MEADKRDIVMVDFVLCPRLRGIKKKGEEWETRVVRDIAEQLKVSVCVCVCVRVCVCHRLEMFAFLL